MEYCLSIQHEHYEELCALAVSAQIAPGELTELNEHTQTCADCRAILGDFGQIVTQGILPEVAVSCGPARVPTGMTERFIARSHSEGIPLKPLSSPVRDTRRWPLWAYLAPVLAANAVMLVVIANLSLDKLYRRAPAQNTSDLAAKPGPGTDVQTKSLLEVNADLTAELTGLNAKAKQVDDELSLKKRELELAESEREQATAHLAQLQQTKDRLSEDVADRDATILRLNNDSAKARTELERLQSIERANEFLVKEGEHELKDLRAKLASLTEQLNESQQLSAAANQAKDLIVARNLHIVDVDDSDGAGRRERPFGRIFYTEGKNLVFYAYDLSDSKKISAKVNFYAWGSREGLNKPVHSLGIFRADDDRDHRWVLKFDDSSVLAQINCVFVTAESGQKTITQPTGKQILFASLGRPNHP